MMPSDSIYDARYIELQNEIKQQEDELNILNSQEYQSSINNLNKEQWQTIRIPMKHFPIRESAIDLKRIKNIVFAFEDKAKLQIDNIKLTN